MHRYLDQETDVVHYFPDCSEIKGPSTEVDMQYFREHAIPVDICQECEGRRPKYLIRRVRRERQGNVISVQTTFYGKDMEHNALWLEQVEPFAVIKQLEMVSPGVCDFRAPHLAEKAIARIRSNSTDPALISLDVLEFAAGELRPVGNAEPQRSGEVRFLTRERGALN